MAFCSYCKEASKEHLKSCVCGNASYCSKDCQVKDWKTHKPSCPPYVIRESPGKGRGLFATRKIKEGQVILDEYPLIIRKEGTSLDDFQANHYPNIDDETKAKLLNLNDPAENFKILDTDTVENLINRYPCMKFYKEPKRDEISKIYRIVVDNGITICGEEELYSDTKETGVYNKISFINHCCVGNSIKSWVMGDFRRQQVRAIKVIEKDEEILMNFRYNPKFVYGSREFRQQDLLETGMFLCKCSECSLEGRDLEDNEKLRAEIREFGEEIDELLAYDVSLERRSMKRAMKLAQKKTNIVQRLQIRVDYFTEMVVFFFAATRARAMGVSAPDPDIYKREALKFAKMFGDRHIYFYNRFFLPFEL